MKSTFKISSLCFLTIVSFQRIDAQNLRPADSLRFSFALCDFQGEYAIILNYFEFEPPKELVAVGPNGSLCELSFVRLQQKSQDYDGRDIPQNFDKLPGPVYKSQKHCLPSTETAFLVSRRFLQSSVPLSILKPNTKDLEKATIKRIETAKGLKTTAHWNIGTVPRIGSLALAIFEPRNDIILLCLMLITKTKLVFMDYPGDANDEGTRWRVDDGGKFRDDDIKIIAAFQSKEGILLVTSWGGPEGESLSVLLEDGTSFREIGQGYRYWSPF